MYQSTHGAASNTLIHLCRTAVPYLMLSKPICRSKDRLGPCAEVRQLASKVRFTCGSPMSGRPRIVSGGADRRETARLS